MSDSGHGKDKQAAKARHGPRSEVVWSGGTGRQPYGNQETGEAAEASGAHEFAAGDRGDKSGRNLEQSEQAKGTP
ncbi:hypothetical protein GCM10027034_27770 [Ramlibacter solisilvae]|uniref:Uncharacterized protein n=1 Tax=Ramlibacter tataouinensis TaxID=94132 RepID=A0A127JQV6_9BURK|nr:hypothetical protein [Ramlibacter tataouinensis]AMO22424.1 hypothetical protein UC35_05305 [Ramlibacter tataouinensis]